MGLGVNAPDVALYDQLRRLMSREPSKANVLRYNVATLMLQKLKTERHRAGIVSPWFHLLSTERIESFLTECEKGILLVNKN